MKKYIVIAGNIGVGKSSLVSLMCEKMNWKPYYEPVAQNPYLEDFYSDMSRWAFHSQVFFLKHRAASHKELSQEYSSVVQDRSLYEDAEIFASNLYNQNHMSERDYEVYRGLYEVVSDLLPPPDLVVYLRASVKTLQRRINKRGRDMETAIADDYLAQLNVLYESWMTSFSLCPVMTVETDSLDFVSVSGDLSSILADIEDNLKGSQPLLF